MLENGTLIGETRLIFTDINPYFGQSKGGNGACSVKHTLYIRLKLKS